MILLQIIVGALKVCGKRELSVAESELPDAQKDIPVTEEEIRLLVNHAPDIIKEVLKQEQDKE